jgi:hypothetical protein
MQPKPLIEIDTRVLKEDYCNYDLVARCWNDEYRGRVWKNKDRIADFEGTDLDDIMSELRAIVDGMQQEKRRERGKRKPSTAELAAALDGIEPKLSRQQRAMLSVHAKAPLQRVMMRSMIRLGDYATAEPSLTMCRSRDVSPMSSPILRAAGERMCIQGVPCFSPRKS